LAVPWIEVVDAVRTTEAPSTSSGKAFCTVNSTPRTLVPKMRSKCSSVIAPSGIMSPPPALAKRMSSLPALSRSAHRPVEVGQHRGVGPDAGGSCADAGHGRIEFGLAAAGDEDARPWAASSWAVARPMPVVPPVTSAILPSSCLFMVMLLENVCCHWEEG
jgi:hypothetical protein